MNIKGKIVHHISFGKGTVIGQEGQYIEVRFSTRTTKFVFPDAFERFLKAVEPDIQTDIEKIIETTQKEKAVKAKTEQKVEQERQAAASIQKPKEDRPYIPTPRINGRHRTFYVFQGKTFDKEYRGGYMWAPITNKVGTVPHHWARMIEVKKGDIIFHGCNGYIQAISVAKDRYYDCPQPKELTVENMWDRDGRRIDCEYYYLSVKMIQGQLTDPIQVERIEIMDFAVDSKEDPRNLDFTHDEAVNSIRTERNENHTAD